MGFSLVLSEQTFEVGLGSGHGLAGMIEVDQDRGRADVPTLAGNHRNDLLADALAF
jgi:hypothetical protein